MQADEKLVMLGTGHATVTRCYNACFLLSVPGFNLLVDAGGGNGILSQLEKAKVDVADINAIFVTHAHTDHLLGVVWVLRLFGEMMESGAYSDHCIVYGNIQVIDLLYSILFKSCSSDFCRKILSVVDFKVVEDGETIQLTDNTTLKAFDVHTNVPQLGFKTTLPSGMTLACCGDAPLSRVAPSSVKNCDWLIAESFCLESDRGKFHPDRIHHGTVKDAARTAQSLGVSNLIIYHTEDSDLINRKSRYKSEASQYFNGNLFVPNDLDSIPLDHQPNLYI